MRELRVHLDTQHQATFNTIVLGNRHAVVGDLVQTKFNTFIGTKIGDLVQTKHLTEELVRLRTTVREVLGDHGYDFVRENVEAPRPAAEPLAPAVVEDADPTELHDALQRLTDGWDGPDSLAPSPEAKAVLPEVFSRLSRYMDAAETEVDGTAGEVTFSWYFNDHTQSVTVTVLPSGRVVVIRSEVGLPSKRTVLKADELVRLGRAALDAGLTA